MIYFDDKKHQSCSFISVTSMDACVRLFQKATGIITLNVYGYIHMLCFSIHGVSYTACSAAEALMAASLHPAELIKIADHKGKLECGYDADIVLLSEDLRPVMTCIAGEIVWKK